MFNELGKFSRRHGFTLHCIVERVGQDIMSVLGILLPSSSPTAATAEPYLHTSLANTPDRSNIQKDERRYSLFSVAPKVWRSYVFKQASLSGLSTLVSHPAPQEIVSSQESSFFL